MLHTKFEMTQFSASLPEPSAAITYCSYLFYSSCFNFSFSDKCASIAPMVLTGILQMPNGVKKPSHLFISQENASS